ncbi:MAG: DUF3536 domain-containing protein, partial [Candidatus Sumerlaeia bacterium]|nr:DUF3536 domain-containing protein [Candidatus Sumerlaeia bacterium]
MTQLPAPVQKHPRFLCIHGHFYQPPRENPWLEAVEYQDSAAPYHDWNERITLECYGPNTAARISTHDGKILDIRNNYRRISFNFGPTLLQWMEINRPEIYHEIIVADRDSAAERGGHGNSLAQAYNHTILPLATAREKAIQVEWGMEDFRTRFHRDPEGMWLAETAVDTDTLEVLAANGIEFTVLAQRQARRWRPVGGREGSPWHSSDGSSIDPTRPYVYNLPSGRSIVLFFYDQPISQSIAFEGLLHDGGHFAHRLMMGFSPGRDWPQLLSIATDGESYGHHHHNGEMALAYALHVIEQDKLARLTNFGEYLSLHPPDHEVQPWEKSSWSCVHGVERWRSDCGCSSGMHPDWHQRWRGPLRQAFRLLADEAEAVYTENAPQYLRDPEAALREYVRVLIGERGEKPLSFIEKHVRKPADPRDSLRALRLLEIMRNAHLIFTSCAWFFDEVTGIETVQNLKYAGRLLQLVRPYRKRLESRFLELLERAESNLDMPENAAEAYRLYVRPQVVDLQRVLAHHSIVNFDRVSDGYHRLFCFQLVERDSVVRQVGSTTIKLARVDAMSEVDGEQVEAICVVLHFGGHDFRCSVSVHLTSVSFEEIREMLLSVSQHQSLTELVRLVDDHFGREYYSLDHLFSEGRRELLQRITVRSFERFEESITSIFIENRKFMDYLLDVGAPLPAGFLAAADFVLKKELLENLGRFRISGDDALLMETSRSINRYQVRVAADHSVVRRLEVELELAFQRVADNPSDENCNMALALLEVVRSLRIHLNYWEEQNIVFALLHGRSLPSRLGHNGVQQRMVGEGIPG